MTTACIILIASLVQGMILNFLVISTTVCIIRMASLVKGMKLNFLITDEPHSVACQTWLHEMKICMHKMDHLQSDTSLRQSCSNKSHFKI